MPYSGDCLHGSLETPDSSFSIFGCEYLASPKSLGNRDQSGGVGRGRKERSGYISLESPWTKRRRGRQNRLFGGGGRRRGKKKKDYYSSIVFCDVPGGGGPRMRRDSKRILQVRLD